MQPKCCIVTLFMYWLALEQKRQTTGSLPYSKNERQWSVNDYWPCILENPNGCTATLTHNGTIGRLSRQQWSLQHAYYVLKISCQWSVNNFWPCISQNPWALQQHRPIMALSAAFLGKNGRDNIAAMS